MKILQTIIICILMASCTTVHVNSDGLVEFSGRQANIVGQNNIAGLVPIAAMSGGNGMYGLGAYEGLDGEITIFQGRPYITQVRDGNIVMRHDTDGSAIFAAWTKNDTWRDEPIPPDVNSSVDLQRFIRARAGAAGIDTAVTAFPFLIRGAPAELEWHINLDRTDGRTGCHPRAFSGLKRQLCHAKRSGNDSGFLFRAASRNVHRHLRTSHGWFGGAKCYAYASGVG